MYIQISQTLSEYTILLNHLTIQVIQSKLAKYSLFVLFVLTEVIQLPKTNSSFKAIDLSILSRNKSSDVKWQNQ